MSTRALRLITIGFILPEVGACRQAAPPAEAQTERDRRYFQLLI